VLPTLSPRFKLLLAAAAIVVVPFGIRAANRLALDEVPGPGYLPSLEIRRTRRLFDPGMIENLQYGVPRWVFIGDSMLGTRVDPQYLSEIASTHDEHVEMVMAPATGPAWWFLAFKNWVVASGVAPRCTFIFFRDTNLTDTMFRLESQYGNILDLVAHEWEPELDRLVAARRRGAWARAYSAVNRAYELDIARAWMEPGIRGWFTRFKYPNPDAQFTFEARMEESFGLEHLRKDVASDLGALDEPDFARDLPNSILPDLLRLSHEHQLPVCFVRVQRRPVNHRPPEQSPALQKYIAELEKWIEANGGMFHDDTGDPEMTLELYEDGDHVANRRRYTEILRARLDPLFR
jgi:hypothetical protein